jgi:hypothetical protein
MSDFRILLALAILLEVAQAGMALFQSRQGAIPQGPHVIWTRLAIGVTFGAAILLAILALQTLSERYEMTALSLAAMSLSASQIGFALYYLRPRSVLPSKERLRTAWKQGAFLSFASYVAAFILFCTSAEFVVQ